jgi:hypothetical protein
MSAKKRNDFTDHESKLIREAFIAGRMPGVVAKEIRCASAAMKLRFKQLRKEGVERNLPPRLPKSPLHQRPKTIEQIRQSEQERRAARFYHSTFEL